MRAMRFALPAAASFVLLTQAAIAAPVLIPHRAVYDLALDRASEKTGISGMTGRMVYEFDGSPCEGYTVSFRFVTQTSMREMSRMDDQQTTTFEDGEGKSFSFVTKSFVDRTLDHEVKGTATVGSAGLNIALDKPDQEKIELNRSQFPTQHLIELIGKAEAGESFYETTIFDGSDKADEVMTTTVVIGKEEKPIANDPEMPAAAAVKDADFWPVSIAYFGQDNEGGEEIPVYSISFKLHANGVTRGLSMDYGDFALTGKLVNLETFDRPKTCAK